jgi:hypothetical protein
VLANGSVQNFSNFQKRCSLGLSRHAAIPGTQWSKELDAQAVSRATKEYLANAGYSATKKLNGGGYDYIAYIRSFR